MIDATSSSDRAHAVPDPQRASLEFINFVVRTHLEHDVGKWARLAQEHEALLDLLVGEEDLVALIDPAFQETRAAHAARSHPAAKCELHSTLQRLVENRGAPRRRKGEPILSQQSHLYPVAPVRRTLFLGARQWQAFLRTPGLTIEVLDTVLLGFDVAPFKEALTREAVRLEHRPQARSFTEEVIEMRKHFLLRNGELGLELRSEAQRPHRLEDEMANTAVVGSAEDRLELRHVQARDDDLLGDADPDAQSLGEALEHREALERLEKRISAVSNGIDLELRGGVGGVEGDVEILEARLQDLQGEARVGERAEVR